MPAVDSEMDRNAFVLLLLSGTVSISLSALQQFYYVNESKSWLEAQSFCRRTYVDLATVGSLEEMSRLTAAVDPAYRGAVWIGLRKGWVTSAGENLSIYTNWSSGQPSEGTAEAACGLTTQEGWHDWYCSSRFFFICFDDRADVTGGLVLINFSKTWTEAQTYCSQHHTNLASISNAQQQQQILNVLGSNSAWFGLISGQWSDERFSNFRFWASGQLPESTLNKACAAVMLANSGNWTQRQCDLQSPFICYGGLQPLLRSYHFVNVSRTWQDAQKYCRNRFTDLATVDSLNDVSRLKNEVDRSYTGSFWIGLTRATQARWGWSGGDELLSNFSNWDRGTASGNGQCGVTVYGVWRTYDCTATLYFVCYYEVTGYILVESSKTWFDAQSYCRSKYTDLASIHSPWEQKQVTSLVPKNVSVWVGLFLDTWQWSDQWSLLFRNWAAGQPSTGTGSCSAVVTVNTGKWMAADCSVQQPFICYGVHDRMKKRQIMKVTVSSNGTANLNDSVVNAAILNEIEKKLKKQGMAIDAKLSWRQRKDSQVFTPKPKNRTSVKPKESCPKIM